MDPEEFDALHELLSDYMHSDEGRALAAEFSPLPRFGLQKLPTLQLAPGHFMHEGFVLRTQPMTVVVRLAIPHSLALGFCNAWWAYQAGMEEAGEPLDALLAELIEAIQNARII